MPGADLGVVRHAHHLQARRVEVMTALLRASPHRDHANSSIGCHGHQCTQRIPCRQPTTRAMFPTRCPAKSGETQGKTAAAMAATGAHASAQSPPSEPGQPRAGACATAGAARRTLRHLPVPRCIASRPCSRRKPPRRPRSPAPSPRETAAPALPVHLQVGPDPRPRVGGEEGRPRGPLPHHDEIGAGRGGRIRGEGGPLGREQGLGGRHRLRRLRVRRAGRTACARKARR